MNMNIIFESERILYIRPSFDLIPEYLEMVNDIENEIFKREEKEVPSGVIGEIVMEKLEKLDTVAYVRFASVYREFKDINTFMDELKKVLDRD